CEKLRSIGNGGRALSGVGTISLLQIARLDLVGGGGARAYPLGEVERAVLGDERLLIEREVDLGSVVKQDKRRLGVAVFWIRHVAGADQEDVALLGGRLRVGHLRSEGELGVRTLDAGTRLRRRN